MRTYPLQYSLMTWERLKAVSSELLIEIAGSVFTAHIQLNAAKLIRHVTMQMENTPHCKNNTIAIQIKNISTSLTLAYIAHCSDVISKYSYGKWTGSALFHSEHSMQFTQLASLTPIHTSTFSMFFLCKCFMSNMHTHSVTQV